jgi:hypothetical protein
MNQASVCFEVERKYSLVALAEAKGRYAILTACLVSKEYYSQRVKERGVDAGVWGGVMQYSLGFLAPRQAGS